MLSGGVDSVAVLKQLLEETDDKVYAHHIHIKNNEGVQNIKRYKAEALALRKTIPYMKKTFRDFHYSESTIDVRQIFSLSSLTKWKEEDNKEDLSLIKKRFPTPDVIYYYFIGGILSKITNSSNTYTGDINILSPAYYPYIDKVRSEVIKKKNIVNSREAEPSDKCEVSLDTQAIPGEIDSIFHTTVWPHESNLKRPLRDNKSNHDTIKKRNIKYLGKELMDMVWYCRDPIKKNGKILSCNTNLGFYIPAIDAETGEIYKCRPCGDVGNALIEMEEEQEEKEYA